VYSTGLLVTVRTKSEKELGAPTVFSIAFLLGSAPKETEKVQETKDRHVYVYRCFLMPEKRARFVSNSITIIE